jgi:2-polyprenyl-3-methyl-5-hydroxy-6-metoxy-1,4-benzoquinol methylase
MNNKEQKKIERYSREGMILKYKNDKRYNADPDNFSQHGSNRYSWRHHHGLYFDLRRIKEFVQIINRNKITFKNKKVLDLGTHHGLFATMLSYLKRDSHNVCGCDFITQYIDVAKRTNPGINFIQADLYDLPYKEETFDFVLSNFVFNSIPHKDQIKIGENVSKIVKTNGYILFFDLYDTKWIDFINWVLFFKNEKNKRTPDFNRKKIKKMFPKFKILEEKSIINVLRLHLLRWGFSYEFVTWIDRFLPKWGYVCLLQKCDLFQDH